MNIFPMVILKIGFGNLKVQVVFAQGSCVAAYRCDFDAESLQKRIGEGRQKFASNPAERASMHTY